MRLLAEQRLETGTTVAFQIWERNPANFVLIQVEKDGTSLERGSYRSLQTGIEILKGLLGMAGIKDGSSGFSMSVAPYPKSRFDRDFEV